ncbi:hemin transporter HemP [Thiocapsa imhoffii]|uniref:Hemin transporter HemP n=1 Tax=Thiocapsa imhoffii TaxID=382777 RepID=A0A9X1B8J7_9GAMM|nr:hemin uptake protein HemP [Thiocapsa imhoffii]MBK1644150.1 hemin transporter HemP [Thiocapsa imhoffii]
MPPETLSVSPNQPPQSANVMRSDLPRIDSNTLLRGNNLLFIDHAGDRYILRMTRNNKLILTK